MSHVTCFLFRQNGSHMVVKGTLSFQCSKCNTRKTQNLFHAETHFPCSYHIWDFSTTLHLNSQYCIQSVFNEKQNTKTKYQQSKDKNNSKKQKISLLVILELIDRNCEIIKQNDSEVGGEKHEYVFSRPLPCSFMSFWVPVDKDEWWHSICPVT